jgi:predicted small metal-binding protein
VGVRQVEVRNIGSKEGMVEGVEGISCTLEGVVIHSSSKEVHGPGHIVLGWVLKGLVGEWQEELVVHDDADGKQHVVGGLGVIDCVDVVLSGGWEVNAGEEEAVEAGMQKHLVLSHSHESKACWNSSDVILVGRW